MYTLEEDKQEIQKQLGCMNGIFQLFDRGYLLGQRNHHKKPPQGQCVTHNKFKNSSDRLEDQGPNTVMKEKHRESVDSFRNSFSSSRSSLDCFKRAQTEPSSFCPSIVSESVYQISNNKHDLCGGRENNIGDIVKASMTRKPRAVPVRTVAKNGRKGPTMTHVDSPRLLQHPKPVTYERRDQNLVKVKETHVSVSRGVKDVKETSRFSYDDRVSPYKSQSYPNIKGHPRHSLDSQKSSIKHNAIDQSPARKPGSNKPPPSSLVARLMGLDVINCEALKIKPRLDDKKTLVSNALIEPAPWKQEVEKRVNVKVNQRPEHACHSVYGQLDKRLTEVGLRTTGKDLRALKYTLETIQKVKKVNPGKGHGRNITPTRTKTTGRTKKQVSPSHTTECSIGVSQRHQRSKTRKQSIGHLTVSSMKNRVQSRRDTRHIRNISEHSDIVSLPSESDASVSTQNEPDDESKGTQETKNKLAVRLMGYNPIVEEPSPISILDAFYTEDTPSPIKKKPYASKDDEDSCFDEQENQVDHLINNTELNQLTFGSYDTKYKNIKQHVHRTELQATINRHDGTNEDHIYVKEIISASGILKNIDLATTILHLHPTGTLINPELFNIIEKTKEYTSQSERIKRKLLFDIVNNILVQKLSRPGCPCPGPWTSKRKRKFLDATKLLEELGLEINDLHTNKRSEELDDYSNEVSSLVFDIEQLVFEDLITEIMNALDCGPR